MMINARVAAGSEPVCWLLVVTGRHRSSVVSCVGVRSEE